MKEAITKKDGKGDEIVKLVLDTADSLDQRLSELLGNLGKQIIEIVCGDLTQNRILNALSAITGVEVKSKLQEQEGVVVIQDNKWRTVTIQKNGVPDTTELGISKAIAV